MKEGQDLEKRVAHPHQELPGVPTLRGGGGGWEGADNTPWDLHWEYAYTPMGSKSIGQEMRLLFY